MILTKLRIRHPLKHMRRSPNVESFVATATLHDEHQQYK